MRKLLYIALLLLFAVAQPLFAAGPQRKGKAKAQQAAGVSSRAGMVYAEVSAIGKDMKTVRHAVERQVREKCDTLFLTVFSDKGAAIKTGTFENMSSGTNLFVWTAQLTVAQLSAIVNSTPETAVVVSVELDRDNRPFAEALDFPLFSAEGMRFVDDYMEQMFSRARIPYCRIVTDCTAVEMELYVVPLLSRISEMGTAVKLDNIVQ